MRLGDQDRRIIRDSAVDVFGSEARVMLFGSRVDDAKRGDDIDLLILLNDSWEHGHEGACRKACAVSGHAGESTRRTENRSGHGLARG